MDFWDRSERSVISEVHCIQTRLRMASHQTWNIYSPAPLASRQFTQPPTVTPAVTVCLLKAGDCQWHKWQYHMKTDTIGQQFCKLVPGSLATISNDLDKGMAESAGVQRGYVITTWGWPFSWHSYQRDSCRNYVRTPVVAMISISLLYPACPQCWDRKTGL